ISFSFVCGDVKRAPRWVQKIGMEWVHRLVQEPRRLFKRYILVGMPFATSLLTRAAWDGLNRKLRGATPELRSKRLFRSPTNGNGRNGNGHAHANGNGHSNSNGHATTGRVAATEADASAARVHDATHTAPIPAAHARGDGGHAGRALSRLRALGLLGGSVRQTHPTTSIGLSLLDHPVR